MFLFAGYVSVRNRDRLLWFLVMVCLWSNLLALMGKYGTLEFEIIRTIAGAVIVYFAVDRSKKSKRR